MSQLSVSRIHYSFGEFTMNLLGILLFTMDFCEVTMNSLFFSRIYYEFTDFPNSLWFQFVFRIHTLNLLSIKRIHFEFSMNSLGVSLISYEFTLFLEFTMNLLSISRSYQEFTFCFANSLWIHYFITRIHYYLSNCMHSFYILHPD